MSFLKKRELGWRQTIKVGYGEEYVLKKEADEVVDRLIALGDAMSLKMMEQMLNGIRDKEFIDAHNAFQAFVYETGLRPPEHPVQSLPATPSRRKKSK